MKFLFFLLILGLVSAENIIKTCKESCFGGEYRCKTSCEVTIECKEKELCNLFKNIIQDINFNLTSDYLDMYQQLCNVTIPETSKSSYITYSIMIILFSSYILIKYF